MGRPLVTAMLVVALTSSCSAQERPASPDGMPTSTPSPAVPCLSADAIAAFHDYHQAFPPETPPGYFGQGSRRFPGQTLTWYADSRVATPVRSAFSIIATKMQGVLTITEVPYGTAGATIRFVIGTETCVPGYGCIPVGSGCDAVPFMAADKVTMGWAQVTCINPAQVGVALATHELWWHLFFSLIHCPGSTGFCSTAASNGAPNWEGVPGHTELARWLHSVPAGTVSATNPQSTPCAPGSTGQTSRARR